jgi:hypothetical protein
MPASSPSRRDFLATAALTPLLSPAVALPAEEKPADVSFFFVAVFRRDGSATRAERGLAVFNVDKCAHFNFTAHAFFHVRVTEKELTVREYRSADRWKTGAWTPQVRTAPAGVARG